MSYATAVGDTTKAYFLFLLCVVHLQGTNPQVKQWVGVLRAMGSLGSSWTQQHKFEVVIDDINMADADLEGDGQLRPILIGELGSDIYIHWHRNYILVIHANCVHVT